jgi:hypothetical protein
MEYCSCCQISFSGVHLECPLCQANEKINDVIRENEVLRERIDLAVPTAFHGEL